MVKTNDRFWILSFSLQKYVSRLNALKERAGPTVKIQKSSLLPQGNNNIYFRQSLATTRRSSSMIGLHIPAVKYFCVFQVSSDKVFSLLCQYVKRCWALFCFPSVLSKEAKQKQVICTAQRLSLDTPIAG